MSVISAILHQMQIIHKCEKFDQIKKDISSLIYNHALQIQKSSELRYDLIKKVKKS